MFQIDKKVVTAIGLGSDYKKRSLVAQYCTESNIDLQKAWPLGSYFTNSTDAHTLLVCH